MAIYLGTKEDLNFKLGDKQVAEIYLGTALVWPSDILPGKVVDFTASDNHTDKVICVWTDTTIGTPLPTYNLYEAGQLVVEDITSPYDHIVDPGTRSYYLKAVNVNGSTNSNTDNGTSLAVLAKPSKPSSFRASDDQYGKVTGTWLNSVEGNPTPTYDIYQDYVKVATNVTSPYTAAIAKGTRFYYVRAVNSEGETSSDGDNGTSLEYKEPVGSQSFINSGTFVVPAGIYSVNLCMIGGGGGGANPEDISVYTEGGGGSSGSMVSLTVSVTPGQSIAVVIGNGGAGQSGIGGGNTGTNSKFGGYTASGGSGGTIAHGSTSIYRGDGGSRSTCMGTFYDGTKNTGGGSNFFGGQAGFANGGNVGKNGSLGSGGGANYQHLKAGNGGKGFCKVSWT